MPGSDFEPGFHFSLQILPTMLYTEKTSASQPLLSIRRKFYSIHFAFWLAPWKGVDMLHFCFSFAM